MFIYDNAVVDSDRPAHIRKGRYTMAEAVSRITSESGIRLRLLGKHIIIEKEEKITAAAIHPSDTSLHFILEGKLIDSYTGEAVQYATVGIAGYSTGTISNGNGDFRLTLPDSLRRSRLSISHIGYENYEEEIEAMPELSHRTIAIVPKVFTIQEVVVRLVNPLRLLHEMLENREENYAPAPVYLTTFYREGIERKKGIVNLTEAIFRIYKEAQTANPGGDQVKLLKMRRISNARERDTLALRMKAGVNSCLMLDIVRHLPDFLGEGSEAVYNYIQSDITEIDGRRAYVVSFSQKAHIPDPLYRGELYIDAETSALLAAHFSVNPEKVEQATDMFVSRKSRNLRITAREVKYQISYRRWGDRYYISHIRGDLYFRIRKRGQIFSTTQLRLWFEMATCNIDKDGAVRFSRNETLRTRTIFSDTRFNYDARFWDNFNIILPEEELGDAISKINSRMEEESDGAPN
jgi:hypothetical protein